MFTQFLRTIDVNRQLTAEDHFNLYVFAMVQAHCSLDYEQIHFTEQLINEFNNYITNNSNIFLQTLNTFNDNEVNNWISYFYKYPWVFAKPIIWGDRDRPEYYIENLTLSHRFEIYIDYLFKSYNFNIGLYFGRDQQYNQGETNVGIEIKRDMRYKETGNLYIEYCERLNNNGNWINSGIFKQDNTRYFLIGDIDKFWILRKCDLIDIYNKLRQKKYCRGCRFVGAHRGTSQGFIISCNAADYIKLSIDEVIEELAN